MAPPKPEKYLELRDRLRDTEQRLASLERALQLLYDCQAPKCALCLSCLSLIRQGLKLRSLYEANPQNP